ncbi:MAG: hypothetical protein IPM94_12830 [bacterium]|nr:hypothetical protein [bacterium]
MYSSETLIAAYADEDRRLQEVVRQYPRAARRPAPPGGLEPDPDPGPPGLLGRLRRELLRGPPRRPRRHPLSFADFESRNRHELQRLYGLPFEQVREAYLTATRDLLAFLHRHWDDLDEQERTNFTIP